MLLVKTLRVLPYIQNIHIHTHTLNIINDILYALSLSCNLKYINAKWKNVKQEMREKNTRVKCAREKEEKRASKHYKNAMQ